MGFPEFRFSASASEDRLTLRRSDEVAQSCRLLPPQISTTQLNRFDLMEIAWVTSR